MPTYEYACIQCGQHVEVVQSMSDAPLTECGACGGTLRKVFSPIGIVFKGSGFYRTDSRAPAKTGGKAGEGTAGKPGTEAAGASPTASSSTSSTGSSTGGEKSA